MGRPYHSSQRGFTLIELSIVLVIIGLIVGGVLAGRMMIEAAQLRSQLGQIEELNRAAGVFATKYSGYPGDLTGAQAAQFGFVARFSQSGYYDGDHRFRANYSIDSGFMQLATECGFFWGDMAKSGLISAPTNGWDGTFWYAPDMNATQLVNFIPKAKLDGNNIVVASGGNGNFDAYTSVGDGSNWFLVAGIYGTSGGTGTYSVSPKITAAQAQSMDAKADDGMPYSGAIQGTSISGSWLNARITGATECFITSGGATIYNSTYDTPACAMMFRISSLPQ